MECNYWQGWQQCVTPRDRDNMYGIGIWQCKPGVEKDKNGWPIWQ